MRDEKCLFHSLRHWKTRNRWRYQLVPYWLRLLDMSFLGLQKWGRIMFEVDVPKGKWTALKMNGLRQKGRFWNQKYTDASLSPENATVWNMKNVNLNSLGTKFGNKQKSKTINDVPIIKHKSARGQSSRIISSNRVGISSPKNVISGFIQAGCFESGHFSHFIGWPSVQFFMTSSFSVSVWHKEHRNLLKEPCAWNLDLEMGFRIVIASLVPSVLTATVTPSPEGSLSEFYGLSRWNNKVFTSTSLSSDIPTWRSRPSMFCV